MPLGALKRMGGFLSRRTKTLNPETDLLNLRRKVAIVTGGNAGIGLYTIQFLARRGAKVYMGARNKSRALDAIAKLESEGLNSGSVTWLNIDLADPRLVKKAAETVLERENRLDILVNNAAMLGSPYNLTSDGLSDIMVVNHLSPFIFTQALLPLLQKTASEPESDVRIVNVSSRGYSIPGKVDSFIGKEAFNRRFSDSLRGVAARYGYSKLANMLHIKELQKRLDEKNIPITCISLHPGDVATPGVLKGLKALPLGSLISSLFSYIHMTPVDGAITSAFAAASVQIHEARELYKGVYLVPYGAIAIPAHSENHAKLASQLWETTEQIVQELKL